MKLTIHQLDEQLGIVLPDELTAFLGWAPGDVLDAEVENKTLKIVRVESANERGMRIVRRAINNYRGALEALAKE